MPEPDITLCKYDIIMLAWIFGGTAAFYLVAVIIWMIKGR